MTKSANTKSALNVAHIAREIAQGEVATGLKYAALVDFLKANKNQIDAIQADFLAGYISGRMNCTIEIGREILTKKGINTDDANRRTKAEHDAWETAKGTFKRVKKAAGLTDANKSQTAKKAAKAKAEIEAKAETETKPKAETKISQFKNSADLAQFNIMALATISATNDANSKLIKDQATMEKIARIIRDAKAEITRLANGK